MKYLFVTEVGSHMWGMGTPESDHDLFYVYQQPSREYLRTSSFEGTRPAKKYVENGEEIDAQYMEIGHLVGLLKKGNVNAIWAVCSPVVRQESFYRRALANIVKNNLSSQTYASVNGMAHSQINDTVKRAGVRDPQKNWNTAARTIQFGINLLIDGDIRFDPVSNVTPAEVGMMFRELDKVRDTSPLPDVVNREPFEDFLYNIRMGEIEGTCVGVEID